MNDHRIRLINMHRQEGWDPSHGCCAVARLVKMFKVKKMAEVGVCVGHTATEILAHNELIQYYMIDHWVDKTKYKLIERNFKDKCVTIIRKDSISALADIKDSSLDMVYLDTIHTYPQTKKEIIGWIDKVKPSGIFVGDGYGYKVAGDDGCKRAVHEIFAPRRINRNMGPDYIWWVVKNV